jgi:hypothetical protein
MSASAGPSISDLLGQTLQGGALDQIGAQLGTDSQTTSQAVSAALPMLLGALARNSSQTGGAEALSAALARDHDGSVLDDIGGFLGGGAATTTAGAGILGHLFGGRQAAVEQAVGQSAGLDGQSAGQLMAMLAPLVMGALSRGAQQRGGLDPSILAGMLGGEQASLAQRSPDMMSTLGSLLDSNRDGSIVDDLGRLASRFFTSGSGR